MTNRSISEGNFDLNPRDNQRNGRGFFYTMALVTPRATRQTLARAIYEAPRDVTDKINDFVSLRENPYWTPAEVVQHSSKTKFPWKNVARRMQGSDPRVAAKIR